MEKNIVIRGTGIYTPKNEVGNEYFEESLSKSDIVQAAWRMYEKYDSGDNSVVKRYPGKVNKSIYDSQFNEREMVEYSREDYKTQSGRYLDSIPCIYLISDKCLSKDSQEVTSHPVVKSCGKGERCSVRQFVP